MLSEEKNDMLTRVSSGTPAGKLLRRYWHPIAPVLEVNEKRVKPVRLLGEDLVLFARGDGDFGLVSRACPHRGTDLSYGWVEDGGIRCPYHGWLFDADGACTSQPFEQATGLRGFRDKVRLDAYPTATLGGLVWAYMGPQPAPLLPDLEPFSWSKGFTEIILTELPCNWFQCHENGMDPVHFEWLHSNWIAVQNGQSPARAPEYLNINFEEFELGFISGREVDEGDNLFAPVNRTTRTSDGGIVCMWPYALATGKTLQWRVPMDDQKTLNITWQYLVLPTDAPKYHQDPQAVPYWYGPLTDPVTGRVITSHVQNQDFAAWVSQGAVANRSSENLGRTDIGITLLRRRYLQEMERVAAGEDPPGVIRDPGFNVKVQLPTGNKKRFIEGITRAQFNEEIARRRRWGFSGIGDPSSQAGRPDHVQAMYESAARSLNDEDRQH